MSRARVVIVGAGFAGYHTARELQKCARDAEIVLINPTDYFLYLPLLPEVAAGILEPRRICVSLPDRLPKVRLVLGRVTHVDGAAHRVEWVDPEAGAAPPGSTGWCSPQAASTSCFRYPVSPNTPTAFGASPRPCTYATTSPASSSWPR